VIFAGSTRVRCSAMRAVGWSRGVGRPQPYRSAVAPPLAAPVLNSPGGTSAASWLRVGGTANGAVGSARRHLHQGHVGKTLGKLDLPRHQWLKEVRQAPNKSEIRRQKDRYLRELAAVHQDIGGLFRDDKTAAQAVQGSSSEELRDRAIRDTKKEDVNEALRMYRLLRPDAAPFWEEDSMLSMQAKLNKTLQDDKGDKPGGGTDALQQAKLVDQQAFLPVVNHRAFLIALESITASLADDVETLCLLSGLEASSLPDKTDGLRFKKLVDMLFGAFPLRKDSSRVSEFMEHSWPRLKSLLPAAVARLSDDAVQEWLEGHLRRVRLNQIRLKPMIMLHQGQQRFGDEEWYSFAEDFPYDDDPMPADLADERNLDFPLEQAGEMMRSVLGILSQSAVAADAMTSVDGTGASEATVENTLDEVSEQFQDLVWDLERVGLRNWLRMDVADLDRYLPKGEVQPSSLTRGGDPAEVQENLEVAKMMLKCAARDRANLLDFEAVDPYKLMHELPAPKIEEELQGLRPTNPELRDADLESMVDEFAARSVGSQASADSQEEWLRDGATVDEVFRKELNFYRTAGPAEWLSNKDGEYQWQWKAPGGAMWDKRRGIYVPEQKGIDPSLELKEMRQHLLEMKRMGGMTKDGRIYYFRGIVVVGNGRGIYGFGVGFGNSPKEARTDSALKALQNLDYVDMDPGKMFCFPTVGQEYKYKAAILPRPIGRGVRCNKKFLPLMYILGLDNCRLKFPSWGGKWFPRIRAIKRCLDGQISRRTLANMTGKRHALLVAPGDHWVHWPDRWFENIRETYDAKAHAVKLARQHALHFKKRGSMSNKKATAVEVKPGWRKDNWARWTNPLERWLQDRRGHVSNPYDPTLAQPAPQPSARAEKIGAGTAGMEKTNQDAAPQVSA